MFLRMIELISPRTTAVYARIFSLKYLLTWFGSVPLKRYESIATFFLDSLQRLKQNVEPIRESWILPFFLIVVDCLLRISTGTTSIFSFSSGRQQNMPNSQFLFPSIINMTKFANAETLSLLDGLMERLPEIATQKIVQSMTLAVRNPLKKNFHWYHHPAIEKINSKNYTISRIGLECHFYNQVIGLK